VNRRGERVALFRDVIRQPIWIETLAIALLTPAMDLRLQLDRSKAALEMHFQGVDEVLSAHDHHSTGTVDDHRTE
jgi:hypothetical protein